MIKLKLPYIPGLLNFREVPHYITLLNEVKNHPDYKKYVPDIIMVDGNGILHTRGCGAACQLGYLADIPCLGVAKKLLTVDGVTLRQIDQQFDKEGGKLAKIIGASGKLHGMVNWHDEFSIEKTELTLVPIRHLEPLPETMYYSYRAVILSIWTPQRR